MVVHCGVIENAANLRTELEMTGHRFTSAHDGEVIPHAVEDELNHGADAFEAFQAAVHRLSGSWAIAALIARHNSIFIARYRSPLLVRGTVGRCVAATDPAATDGVRGPLRILEDGSIAELGTMWRWAGTPGRPPAPTPAEDLGPLVAPPTAPGPRRGTLQHH
jgi:glucosamine--fructose-6-phosphate aminotransferase (isomerizing)